MGLFIYDEVDLIVSVIPSLNNLNKNNKQKIIKHTQKI